MGSSASTDDSRMSDYERTAWQALLGEADKQGHQSDRFGDWTRSIKGRVNEAAARARAAVERVPGADVVIDTVDATVTKAMEGLHTALVERGLNSVRPADVFRMFAAQEVQVQSYDDVRRLDLKLCDGSVPPRRDRYLALAVTEGAASSLAVTGAVLSTTVSGGTTTAVAVTAIVADVTTVMVGMGRIVALVGAHYGYDVREPEEQLFASGVIAYSTAGSPTDKAAALASLSRLTQQMMARATWRHLRQQQTVNVIQRVFTSLGFNLTKRKLAQVVPVVGAVINGGLNARIAHQTFERAQQVYRLRFLTEKYGLDPARWAPPVAADAGTVDIPLVDEVLEEELALHPTED
ncbi:MAG TPA: EcsC family protein [Mycobacterium sp.]|nr:EcsC family protein [Mycobacterium sp.]